MIKFGQRIKTDEKDVKYWITSDLHFFHKGIMNFCKETRPWDNLDDMHEGLITHWNSVVGKNDIVIHVGDFCFSGKEKAERIIRQLNGNIVFVLGNHDKAIRDSMGDVSKMDYLEFRFNGTKVCVMHYHISNWNQQGRGSVMLFGHSHGSYFPLGRTMDVGFDAHGRILSLQETIDRCLEQDVYCTDHHNII